MALPMILFDYALGHWMNQGGKIYYTMEEVEMSIEAVTSDSSVIGVVG